MGCVIFSHYLFRACHCISSRALYGLIWEMKMKMSLFPFSLVSCALRCLIEDFFSFSALYTPLSVVDDGFFSGIAIDHWIVFYAIFSFLGNQTDELTAIGLKTVLYSCS